MSASPATALRTVALAGLVVFTALFMVRAANPFDPTLIAIGLALVAVTAAAVAGARWAGWLYLVFPIALFTTPAIREVSFNLSAIDSTAWRWHGIAILVSMGLATVAAVVVATQRGAAGDRPSTRTWAAALGGGLALGLLFLVVTPRLYDAPGFGGELTDEEIAALPTIDLLNFRYGPGTISVDRGGLQRFRLDNPSDLPHTVTIDVLDVEVRVPAGRWAVLEFDASQLLDSVAFYCSVGEHRDLGMSGLLAIE